MFSCRNKKKIWIPYLYGALIKQLKLHVAERVVESSNFITCPQTSKWSKSTRPRSTCLNIDIFLISQKKSFVVTH